MGNADLDQEYRESAKTREQLAILAHNTYFGEVTDGEWIEETVIAKRDWHNVVTAILRAAKPTLDLSLAGHVRWGKSVLYEEDTPAFESYIRYRVEVPPDETPAHTKEASSSEPPITLERAVMAALYCYHRGLKYSHEHALIEVKDDASYLPEFVAALEAKGGA